eukprot:491622_1
MGWQNAGTTFQVRLSNYVSSTKESTYLFNFNIWCDPSTAPTLNPTTSPTTTLPTPFPTTSPTPTPTVPTAAPTEPPTSSPTLPPTPAPTSRQQPITGIWDDDFAYDISGVNGWKIYNKENNEE